MALTGDVTVATGKSLVSDTLGTDTINERTGEAGVTIDSVLIKDGAIAKSVVGLTNVDDVSINNWAGSGNITTVGTLASGDVPWSLLSSVPTTISGYGITDALSNSASSTADAHFGDTYLQDDTSPSHYLKITNGEDLTAAHVLTLVTGNADRTLTMSGDASVSGINTGDEDAASIKTALGVAATAADGYLVKEDWNTFNGKVDGAGAISAVEAELTLALTGDVTVGHGERV